jgi:hypothetical protein
MGWRAADGKHLPKSGADTRPEWMVPNDRWGLLTVIACMQTKKAKLDFFFGFLSLTRQCADRLITQLMLARGPMISNAVYLRPRINACSNLSIFRGMRLRAVWSCETLATVVGVCPGFSSMAQTERVSTQASPCPIGDGFHQQAGRDPCQHHHKVNSEHWRSRK